MANQPTDTKSTTRSPTIERDDVQDAELRQISADQLLAALNADGLGTQALRLFPDKKKLELVVEPENLGAVKVKDLIQVLRHEKKKTELEVFDDLRARVSQAYYGGAGGSYGYPGPDQPDRPPWWPGELVKGSIADRFIRVFSTQIIDAIADRVVDKLRSKL